MMTALPRGCRAALPKACRAKTPCRVSVVAVTVCAAGASGTWDIYSQIASRLKSLQARYSADHVQSPFGKHTKSYGILFIFDG